MKLQFFRTQLRLKETFSIAYGNYDFRNALVIQLSHAGESGFGECVEINYYHIHLENFISELEKICTETENRKITHPSEFYHFLTQKELHPFLKSAMDCAYWDLYGKLEKKTFAELNAISVANRPDSSLTISIAPVSEQIRKIESSSWPCFKVKCNGFRAEDFQQLLNLDRKIALDANTSFSETNCLWLQENPESQKLLYVEQPMPVGNFNSLDSSRYTNWMADEDVQNASFLDQLQPHYQSVNIKLMKCGGLTPALEMIRKAKQLGYKVMLGCMTESSIGISAACALAGLLDFADLDGANLISNDYAKGSFVEEGKIRISEEPGLGIRLR